MPIVTIYHKGGRVEIKPQGYTGNQCQEATRPYEEARTGIKKQVLGDECHVQQGVGLNQQQKLGQ